jgi:hypothetical protein
MLQVGGWIVFFSVYAVLFYEVTSWGAKLRIAGSASITVSARLGYFVSVVMMATAPGLALPLSRVALGWGELSDVAFAFFVLAWVAAALPGIRKSRGLLRLAGVNPDAEA